ncbi:hypothetical protein TNCV_2235481 [Trichonephila clavipes]|nr:hypothetical protein TNCV_2235481 [Trichonephila clavipes]
MFLAEHPSQGCFGLQSHCAPCYFFIQAYFYPSDFSFMKCPCSAEYKQEKIAGTGKRILYPPHKGHTKQVTASKERHGSLKIPGIPSARTPNCVPVEGRRVLPSQIHFSSVEGMNFRIAQDSNWGYEDHSPPTSQVISCLVPRHTHMRWYPMETHLFSETKPSQFPNNI